MKKHTMKPIVLSELYRDPFTYHETEEERIAEAMLQANIAHIELLISVGIDPVKECEARFGPNQLWRIKR